MENDKGKMIPVAKKKRLIPINTEISILNDGKWIIDSENNIGIDCYVTSDLRRVLSLRGTARAMGLAGGGSNALVRNLKSNWIQPYLSDDLKQWVDDVDNNRLQYLKGIYAPFIPFDGELFVDLCKAYISAKNDGLFDSSQWNKQSEIADKLLAIMSAFAKVGIVALIDEITGYQEEREKDALQVLLSYYVSQELLPWTKTFPDEFYIEMFRLRGWDYKGKAKSPYVGKLTNYLVYDRLPTDVVDELKRLNPILKDKGYRKYRLFQRLTKEQGYIQLKSQIMTDIAMMRGFNDWDSFNDIYRKSYNISEPLEEEQISISNLETKLEDKPKN